MKRFPVYVVRVPIDEGCGHQHQTQSAAHNCAVNIMRSRVTLPWARVIRVRRTLSDTVQERTVETIEATDAT
jgi:hypothetical protein